MKSDARVRYTLMIIRQVFLEQLQQKPIHKITVKEICDLAEINRSTFYKHYEDVYDLKTKLEEEVIHNLHTLLSEIKLDDIQNGVVFILYGLKKNINIYNGLVVNPTDCSLGFKLGEIAYQYIKPRLNISPNLHFDDYQKSLCYTYVEAGTSGIIQHWIYTGLKEEPEKIADMIERLNFTIKRSLEE